MKQWARRGLAPLSAAVALVAITALAPTGGTQAAWTDARSVTAGPVTNDGVGLAVTAQPLATTLPGSSTLAVRNTSGRLAGRLAVTSTVTPAGWNSGLAGQLAVSYAECASGGPVTTTPLPAEHTRDLCLTATPQQTGAALLRQHAGAAVDVTSTVTQQAVPAPTWTANTAVTTRHRLDFPRPTHPGGTLSLGAVCAGATIGQATLYWAWPDSSSSQSAASPAVNRWGLQRWNAGTQQWVEVTSNIPGQARSTRVGSGLLLGLGQGELLRIVGYASADPNTPVIGTYQVRVSRVLDLLGIGVGVRCTGVEAAP